jgi:hypothetical protein
MEPSSRALSRYNPCALPRNLRPIRLSRRSEPFDSELFIYELKIDGYRAGAHRRWKVPQLWKSELVAFGIFILDDFHKPIGKHKTLFTLSIRPNGGKPVDAT